MLNYDKMDSVLQNLDDCVENMKNVSETQEKLEDALTKIETVVSELRESKTAMTTSVEAIEKIEKTHEDISLNIEAVLQDYKKIHSAFEFVELELKKTSSSIESLKAEIIEKLDEANKQVKITRETLVERIETAKNEGLQHFNEVSENNHNKLMKGIYVSIGISACAVILLLIGLFL